VAGGPDQLGDRLFRILPGGAGQPHRLSGLFRRQLKTMQEIITLLVFGVFSILYLGESVKWNHMVAFAFLCGAAFFSFHKWS
jgi:hypothetical protein